ncbi:MAG: hypothetical protein NTY14_05365 [Candidatus Omnitrophica bacterium]|nr:hypothetical protein [Candidatus Omnitrophota bacterium]
MKKTILFSVLVLSVTAICFAQSNYTESLTITTYYPAPYGEYRQLRVHQGLVLVPQTDLSNITSPQRGMIAFNGSDNQTYVYLGASRGWQPLASTGGDALVNSVHTQSDCTNAGGEVAATNVGFKQCRFGTTTNPVTACPSGWTHYQSWTTTIDYYGTCSAQACTMLDAHHYCSYYADNGCVFASCTAIGHPWQNTDTIESCPCTASPRVGNEWCPQYASCPVYAVRTQIGCF